MSEKSDPKRKLDKLKRTIKRAAQEARARSRGSGGGTPHSINVAHRVNAVVAANVGEPGSTRRASAMQTVHTRQDHGQTTEAYESTERTVRETPGGTEWTRTSES